MQPIISVLGRKDTGKTALVEKLILEFTKRKYNILTGKHVGHDLELDVPGTDSYRHLKAGSEQVFLLSKQGSAFYQKKGDDNFSLDLLNKYINENINLIILEGFSKWIKDNSLIGKIICYTNENQIHEYKNILKPPILGQYSYLESEKGKDNKLIDPIIKNILEYIDNFKKIITIYETLPELNCRKCGYNTCLEFAQNIFLGKEKREKCAVLNYDIKDSIELNIFNEKIPLNKFTSNFIRNTTLGMVSSLKKVDKNIIGKIRILIE